MDSTHCLRCSGELEPMEGFLCSGCRAILETPPKPEPKVRARPPARPGFYKPPKERS